MLRKAIMSDVKTIQKLLEHYAQKGDAPAPFAQRTV